MGLSSSKTSTKSESTSTASPYATAQPYIDAGLAASNNVFNTQQPVLSGLASTAQDAFNSIAPGAFGTSPFVSGAQTAASGIFNSGTGNNPGAKTYGDVMGSTGSLGAGDATLASFTDPNNVNPYLDAITQQATDAAQKATNQRFGASGLGAGLSSAYTGALGSAVANANNATRYGAYNDSANRAITAAGALSSGSRADTATRLGAAQAADSSYNAQQQQILSALGLTGSLTSAQYAGVDPALNLLNASATIPYTGVNALAGQLNTLAGRYGTTESTGTNVTKSSPSLASILAQAAGQAAGAYAAGG